ncbi:MAG: hypothetical protein KGH65_04955 [Candidatus Micrarchaeota archaeon]|nr:hypothetical protein [Candidatus Micrarchaeota archaeon]
MASEIILEGRAKFDDSLRLRADAASAAASRFVSRGGVIIADSAKEQFRSRPSGSRRVSQRTGNIWYDGTGSYAAQPPNPTLRTGNLRQSIRLHAVTELGKGRWMSQTGPHIYYGGYVENGGATRGNGVRRPFPYLRMGVENAAERLQMLADEEWAKAVEE